MKIISFTKNGCVLNKLLCDKTNAKGFTTYDYEGLEKTRLRDFTKTCFENKEDMVFIGAAGIAVRSISEFLEDKFTDPAVVVVDEKGRFAVPILSGHVGGGNTLAIRLSEILGAQPVISTATDINDVFAVDIFAKNNSLISIERNLLKKVSAALLEKKDMGFFCQGNLKGQIPFSVNNKNLGISISYKKDQIFNETLHLVPKVLCVGIGCRKGVSKEAIKEFTDIVFSEENLFFESVLNVSTIDIKKEETGLLEFCKETGLELLFYSAEELKKAKGSFIQSEFVSKVTGVDNVCERAACLSSENGKAVVKKRSLNGVTISVYEKIWSVGFE